MDDRLESLNTGQGFSDEFETELSMYSVKSNSSHKYKEFVTNVKVSVACIACYKRKGQCSVYDSKTMKGSVKLYHNEIQVIASYLP